MGSGEQREATSGNGGARWAGSWLGGVRSAGVDLGYPGERYGLPESGPRSVASYGRRLLALFLDWGISLLIASFLARSLDWGPQGRSLATLAVFGVQMWVLIGLAGTTLGKLMLRLRVARLDGRPVGLVWSLVRAVLLLLVVPALLWDRDYRGLHDRASNTIVLNG